jgi:hypothetical protein
VHQVGFLYTKIRSLGAQSFHAGRETERRTERRRDGQTNMMKIIVAFRNFVNAPKSLNKYDFRTLHLSVMARFIL